jgi:hypothetical protein
VPWLCGLILAAGVVLAIVSFWPSHHVARGTPANVPVQAPVNPKTVRLSKAATSVARTFLRTAVARADLDAAWKISDANVRGGLTHAEWMTGNIPVIPYPLESLAVARFKIDHSYSDDGLLEVALLPRDGASIKPQIFYLGLKRLRGPDGKPRWVVDRWLPRSSTLVPKAS